MPDPLTSEGVKVIFPGYTHEGSVARQDFSRTELDDNDLIHLDLPQGSIKMKQWAFDGIRLVFSDWVFKSPTPFEWQGSLDAVTMLYCLRGSLSIEDGSGGTVTFGAHQHNSHYAESFAGLMKVNTPRLTTFMLQFDKDAFLRIAGSASDSLKYFAGQIANGQSCHFSKDHLPIDINTQHVINTIRDCRFSPPLKKIFFLSKAFELLVLQADAHDRSLQNTNTHLRSDYDRDRIIFAKDYMMQHIDTPPTIPELAKISGINEFKLKKGYKEIFGSTIFGHLAEARLELARHALHDTTRSVSEIASELGYSSVQHFCTAFKKRFGTSPNTVRPK